MRKQNKDFKEMVVLLCLVKSFKNSAFDEHKALFKIPRWNTKGIQLYYSIDFNFKDNQNTAKHQYPTFKNTRPKKV